jgi:hypothetical protein
MVMRLTDYRKCKSNYPRSGATRDETVKREAQAARQEKLRDAFYKIQEREQKKWPE